jgi:uncharacterized protein with PIN domain
MPTSKSTLKTQLVAQAEAAIEALLKSRPAPETATLTQIEEVVLKASHDFRQTLTAALLAESSARVSPSQFACPKCGGRAPAKGKRKRRVMTRTGEVSVQREYYYCRACHAGFFPPR